MTDIESDYVVYSRILEPIFKEKLELGRKYCSPIPRGNHYETSGSFVVYEYKGKLLWKDWGLTDQMEHQADYLLMRLYGIEREEAEKMIDGYDLPEAVEIKRQKRYKLILTDTPDLRPSELDWWAQYHVSEETLRMYNVRGVISLMSGKNPLYRYSKSRPAFSYRGGPNLESWQFYSPNPKKFWRSPGKGFIYGLDQLPYIGDDLIIVSGMKDGLCLFEASGIPFIAGSGEGAWRQVKDIQKGLSRRFKRLWTLMDPDIPGRTATSVFLDTLGIPPYPFNYLDDKMDIAQLSKSMGIEWLRSKLKQHA